MWKIYLRTGLLGGAFLAGILIPRAASLASIVPGLIMVMLTVSFLKSGVSWKEIAPLHGILLAVMPALAFAVYFLLKLCGAPQTLAEGGFYIAFTPTAAAAPVIMSMLDGNVKFVTASTVLTNLAAAVFFPVILVVLNGAFHGEIFFDAAGRVAEIVLLPAAAAEVMRRFVPDKAEFLGRKLGKCTFYLWTLTLFLLSSKAGLFLRSSQAGFRLPAAMAVLAGILCAIQFLLGYAIGRRAGLGRECSQSLGQKNTTLSIYLAMTYSSPASALGPVFYIFFHNFWNACQLHFHSRKQAADKEV